MRILIADDNPVSLRILESTLAGWGHKTVLARDGGEALKVLQSADAPPLAILDWIMPEIDGAEICRRLRAGAQSKTVYIILLTAKSSKEEVVEGLEAGADDYLTKPFDRSELKVRVQVGLRIVELQNNLANRVRELEISVAERIKAEEALRNMSLTDDLTGLYNRRGFFAFTEQNLKLTRRMNKSALLLYADMDGLKRINDTFGHQEGSRAISKTAEILRQSFRESDVIARLGGDEFAVFTPDAPLENTDCVTGKLQENIQKYNVQRNHDYELSLSVGAAKITPENISTIDELIVVADEAMYRNKRAKAARRQN